MNQYTTPLGNVLIGNPTELFEHMADRMNSLVEKTNYPPGIALTGGSSPKIWFKWLVEHRSSYSEFSERVIFTVSDERCVPLDSDESNFGNADRLFLKPFGVNPDNGFPWDTTRPPAEAAQWYEKLWELSFGEGRAYDLCMLGMGDDGHIASLFPGSPLLSQVGIGPSFAAIEVAGKGQRLTITPSGLERCGHIVMFVVGRSKAVALEKVFATPEESISELPVRLMKHLDHKVTWLIDLDAGNLINWKTL